VFFHLVIVYDEANYTNLKSKGCEYAAPQMRIPVICNHTNKNFRVIHCLIVIKKSTISIILSSYTTIPHENKKKDKSKNPF